MDQHYPYSLPPLPYAYDALIPTIGERTLHFHHDKHFQTYVDNLNKALRNYPFLQTFTLEQLLCNLESMPMEIRTQIRNNAGAVYNHRFYFNGLSKEHGQRPQGELAEAIDRQYGSYEKFKEEFTGAALSVFGSGYAWLVIDPQGKLKIVTTANQDTPLAGNLAPVLVIDVWEHAYYLKHFNVRADYIKDWFEVVNWRFSEEQYKNNSPQVRGH